MRGFAAALRPYLRPYHRSLLLGSLWLLATTLLAMVIPWMLKLGIEAVEDGHSAALTTAVAVLAAAALVRCATRIASRFYYLHSARRLEVDLRRDLLARLLHQSGFFFDRHRTGDLLARFTGDLANVRMFAGFGLLTIVNAVTVYILTLAVMLMLSPTLTLVAVLPYPLMLLAVKWLSRHLLHHSAQVQEGMGRLSEAVEEGVSGQAVIRAYGLGAGRKARFAEINGEYLRRNLVLARLRALVLPIMTLVGPLGTLLVLYFGGRQVAAGSLSLGDFVAFNAYLVQLAWPTLLLGWVLTLLQRASASMERLQLLLALPPVAPPAALPDVPGAAPEVRVRDLTFAYADQPALRDLSLEVPAGSLIGLAGPAGSGKSTLLRLLAALYPPPPGTLFVDGQDLARVDGRCHRLRVAAVPQEGRLFSGTLGENLLYAAPEASREALADLAARVQLQGEVAEFSQGFDTRVGEGGMSLSGGQRQRVAIGRALARDAGLWLLDDPFSHLDAATARALWEELRPLLSGHTVFLVSGRVSLLRSADRILVFDRGRIAEQGRHEDLIAEQGLYARLYHREQLQDELEAGSASNHGPGTPKN
ncbi:ABC transporter ATP-binding protein [Geoalkalibacter halelectricus]|uniref:ABC transporter ATP-binding protein/permease n=1 Tax=Geoalkalibacter halelectricus TaxID=2847045 RepID=A0ABY5ZMC4_9BACT|nr:ABC transporter ATP-binding protein [Geoalkalibacter halelectricus]MDO3378399.1 ABC transporter ATP-binding protein/permease [Geoalkalibacter halelectricus]UWZ80281.1 ABC transporter ATP-binding protein/permease [Geoalkalibacter halelectricus]